MTETVVMITEKREVGACLVDGRIVVLGGSRRCTVSSCFLAEAVQNEVTTHAPSLTNNTFGVRPELMVWLEGVKAAAAAPSISHSRTQ